MSCLLKESSLASSGGTGSNSKPFRTQRAGNLLFLMRGLQYLHINMSHALGFCCKIKLFNLSQTSLPRLSEMFTRVTDFLWCSCSQLQQTCNAKSLISLSSWVISFACLTTSCDSSCGNTAPTVESVHCSYVDSTSFVNMVSKSVISVSSISARKSPAHRAWSMSWTNTWLLIAVCTSCKNFRNKG